MLAEAMNLGSVSDAIGNLGQHAPDLSRLTALWPYAILLVASILIGMHGERITRIVVLAGFVVLGALLGQRLAEWMSLPPMPTVVFLGSLGGIGAWMFYRWSLGLALAVAMALAAGAWSSGARLTGSEVLGIFSNAPGLPSVEIAPDDYTSFGEIPLPPIDGEAQSVRPVDAAAVLRYFDGVWQRVAAVWSAVAAKPEGQKHLLLSILAGGGVGLLAGLLLGRLAALLLTSVLGGAGLVAAGVSLAVAVQPDWAEWFTQNRQHVLTAGAIASVLFLLRQAAHRRPRPTVVTIESAELASARNKS